MISRTWSRKSIAFCLAVAVLSVYSMVALAAPGQQGQTGPSGELSVSGQVTVNGVNAISGATVFSDSTIATGANSSAIVSLGKLGRVGRARISTNAGTGATITTKDGAIVADAAQANAFSIDTECGNTILATQSGNVELRAGEKVQQVAAGQDATAGQATPGTRCARLAVAQTFGTLSGGALAGLLAAAGGAIAAAIIASTHNSDLNFGGGSVVVVSPTR